MDNWKDHLDKNGMIVQKLGDDCDQAQREGMFALGQLLRKKVGLPKINVPGKRIPMTSRQLLETTKKGDYKRTGNLESRCSRDDMLTRDQATGILALLFVIDHPFHITQFFLNMADRFFFTNNKTAHADAGANPKRYGKSRRDFFGLDQIGNCIRKLKWRLLYPVAWVCDLSLLFSTIRVKINKDNVDVLNYVLRLAISRKVFNTFIGGLCSKLADSDNLYDRIEIYFTRQTYNGIEEAWDYGPPMHEIWSKEMLKKVLTNP